MRLVTEIPLIAQGGVERSSSCAQALDEIRLAIVGVQWPPGSGQFTIYPESGKKSGMGNGVRPVRDLFVAELAALGWTPEATFPVSTPPDSSNFGDMDAAKEFDNDLYMVEWETGNISSSHRALNKLTIGLSKGAVTGGVLIVPTRDMAQYFTDRVGNMRELMPYLSLWQSVPVKRGYLGIFVIEHDATSIDVPRIAKGTDGRSRI